MFSSHLSLEQKKALLSKLKSLHANKTQRYEDLVKAKNVEINGSNSDQNSNDASKDFTTNRDKKASVRRRLDSGNTSVDIPLTKKNHFTSIDCTDHTDSVATKKRKIIDLPAFCEPSTGNPQIETSTNSKPETDGKATETVHPKDKAKEVTNIKSIGTGSNHPIEFEDEVSSPILDLDWFQWDSPPANEDGLPGQVNAEDRSVIGHLLCTFMDGIFIYQRDVDGNWVKVVEWTSEKETLKAASILSTGNCHDDNGAIVVSILSATDQSEAPTKAEHRPEAQDLSLISFAGRGSQPTLRNRIQSFCTHAALPVVCRIGRRDACVGSSSFSSPSSLPAFGSGGSDVTGRIDYFRFDVGSLGVVVRRGFSGISGRLLHLLAVSKSSTVCGLTAGSAYLWHYESCLLLKRLSLDARCRNFVPCCDSVHQDKGLLVVVGRTLSEEEGLLVFLNPTSGEIVSVAFKEIINPRSSSTGKLRLLRCRGPLQKAVFRETEDRLEGLRIFSIAGNKITVSMAAPPSPSTTIDGKVLDSLDEDEVDEMIVRFDSSTKMMFVGRGKKFYTRSMEVVRS